MSDGIIHAQDRFAASKMPKPSKWQCYLFGGKPDEIGIVWRPVEGAEPNWFWRWMQFLAFGNRWVKDK